MSDNIRIKTTPGKSNNINVKINQKFDFIEILSLKISQEEAYKRFCSDYGVVVGRVIVNQGVGVPNAKVSIFIPIDEVDVIDPEIIGLYPYEVITDKDSDGIPYNLLPKSSNTNDDCFTPVGTFPSKREVQDNPELGEIYCKYYKFTTTTNDSGDFMIFGVPTGEHYVHVDVDVSDIGILSQKPFQLIEEGASEKSFASPTKYKGRDESGNPNQIKTASPLSVNVIPFWGDTEECEVGISRIDVNLTTRIQPTALFVGSIFSDDDKHGLNKRCRPRAKMGKLEDLVAGPGTIEMIRKAPNGKIERFDVKGGQVIEDDGTWSYLIPMNLDYMITAEDGSMIMSNDTSKGIPTRADVRFRIGMNISGDEGRLRTRAKFLVPNNPSIPSKADYNFDTSTRPESFTELYWNKIYSVKNYISRVQQTSGVENRKFIGVKDVTEGPNTIFPFNKLDNKINPLFSFLCAILNIVSALICVINTILIPTINLVIVIVNAILSVICIVLSFISSLVCGLRYMSSESRRKTCRCKSCINKRDCEDGDCRGACKKDILPYLPYITLSCSEDSNGLKYAVCGWDASFPPIKQTHDATELAQDTSSSPSNPGVSTSTGAINGNNNTPQVSFHYPNDGHGHGPGAGWIECVSVGLADSLDVFKFDFYNDWVNGSLYAFLLKVRIKKKGQGKMKFCDADCDDNINGADNDENGVADNRCRSNYIVDSCTNNKPFAIDDSTIDTDGINSKSIHKIREGYIKRYKDEFYYSAISKKGNKLFATDMVNLGSMVDCDWQGVPNIHKYLIDTSANVPSLTTEYDENVLNIDVTGFDTKLPNSNLDSRLIGNVYCLPGIAGVLTDEGSCINLRRLCELGTGLDEDRRDETPSRLNVDNRITNNDVENPFIRGAFAYLNSNIGNNIPSIYFDEPYSSTDPSTPPNPSTTYSDTDFGADNEPGYEAFRGLNIVNDIKEHTNSFYFYFGLIPGRSALTNMNKKFFTECTPEDDTEFFIVGNVDAEDDILSGATGQLTVNFIGGVGPYSIVWNGPTINGTPFSESFINYTSSEQTMPNLYVGQYGITVVDSLGSTAEATFYVPGPAPTTCNVQTTDATQFGESDGKITVNINGGTPDYTIDIFNYDLQTGTILTPYSSQVISNLSYEFELVPAGSYKVIVNDDGTPQTQCDDVVVVTEPGLLTSSGIANNISCFGKTDGNITIGVSGGVSPYQFQWAPLGGNLTAGNSTGNYIGNLEPGSYSVTVTDGANQTSMNSFTLTEPPGVSYDVIVNAVGCEGADNGRIIVTNVTPVTNLIVTLDGVTATSVNGTYTFSDLYSDTYVLKVTDTTTNCVYETFETILEPYSELEQIGGIYYLNSSVTTGDTANLRVTGGWSSEGDIQAPDGEISDTLSKWQYRNFTSSTWTDFAITSATYATNGITTLKAEIPTKVHICNGGPGGRIRFKVVAIEPGGGTCVFYSTERNLENCP